ncbi:hypothetical protein EDD18DRAFT_1401003 [Armillaria luteobubalina]|uniref:Uncharacterized protein n=1 Tax=Armillaria luteobubalina TaxID=153913 RepID=A0AA39UVK5_9AGAR|nr:hypothetical protein EDD18DRAFT_1401003 [Armillaria luteobubalina]
MSSLVSCGQLYALQTAGIHQGQKACWRNLDCLPKCFKARATTSVLESGTPFSDLRWDKIARSMAQDNNEQYQPWWRWLLSYKDALVESSSSGLFELYCDALFPIEAATIEFDVDNERVHALTKNLRAEVVLRSFRIEGARRSGSGDPRSLSWSMGDNYVGRDHRSDIQNPYIDNEEYRKEQMGQGVGHQMTCDAGSSTVSMSVGMQIQSEAYTLQPQARAYT